VILQLRVLLVVIDSHAVMVTKAIVQRIKNAMQRIAFVMVTGKRDVANHHLFIVNVMEQGKVPQEMDCSPVAMVLNVLVLETKNAMLRIAFFIDIGAMAAAYHQVPVRRKKEYHAFSPSLIKEK